MVEVLKPSYVASENANDAAIVEYSSVVMLNIELPFHQAVHPTELKRLVKGQKESTQNVIAHYRL